MNNVVIDYPQRLEDEIEGFRLDAGDDEKNYTAARLRLCRDSKEGNPVLFYTQELSRNFKDPRDSFGKRHLIKVFTPGRFQAAADEVITGKFQDTLLAHKGKIPDYSPLSDIHSTRMNLFIDPLDVAFPGATCGVWMVLMAILGGKGTMWGPVIGAVIFHITQEFFWITLFGWQRVAMGILIVVIVVAFPLGILGWFRERWPERFGETVTAAAGDDEGAGT